MKKASPEKIIWRELSPEEKQTLLREGRYRKFRKGDIIFNEKEEKEGLVIILSGIIDIHEKNKEEPGDFLRSLKPGIVFGEDGPFSHCPESVTGRSRKAGALFQLKKKKYERLLREEPGILSKFLLNVLQMMALRNAEISGKIRNFSTI